MAKHKKPLPARKPVTPPRAGDSLSIRSAESLGRMIGTLQRQIDGVMHKLSEQPATKTPVRRKSIGVAGPSERRRVGRGQTDATNDAAPGRRASAAAKKGPAKTRARKTAAVKQVLRRPK